MQVCFCLFSDSDGVNFHWYAGTLCSSALLCLLSLYSPHMASVERKQEKQEPFYHGLGSRRQTSAEIVNEARHSLRTLQTQRPFTPQDEHRQLFGGSARTRDGRPPSSFRFFHGYWKFINVPQFLNVTMHHLLSIHFPWFFISSYSLHARNFDVPDSRPSSGKRLSPLEHVRLNFSEFFINVVWLRDTNANDVSYLRNPGWHFHRMKIATELKKLCPNLHLRLWKEAVREEELGQDSSEQDRLRSYPLWCDPQMVCAISE